MTRKTDRKLFSLYESGISTLLGFLISFFAWFPISWLLQKFTKNEETISLWIIEFCRASTYELQPIINSLQGPEVAIPITAFYIILSFFRTFAVRRVFVWIDRHSEHPPRKSDKKIYTFYESLANLVFAAILSYSSWELIVAPLLELYQAYGGDISGSVIALATTIFYTILSLIRGFILRRVFVWVDKL